MLVMLNGTLVNESEAKLSVMDHAYLYGVGLFETLCIYNGFPFLLEDHFQRLYRGCKKLCIQVPYAMGEWEKQIEKLLTYNEVRNGVARISVTGGVCGQGLRAQYKHPNTVIMLRPLNTGFKKKLKVLNVRRQAPGGVEDVKSTNFLNQVVGFQELGDECSEGLFLTSEGFVAEGLTSNLFFINENSIYTPSLELGILPGITRAFVIELLRILGYNIYEGAYSLSELKEAEGIFITNSVGGIVPIEKLENRRFKTSDPAYKTIHLLREEYDKYTSRLRSIRYLKGES